MTRFKWTLAHLAVVAALFIGPADAPAQWTAIVPLQAKAAAGYLGVSLRDIDPERAADLKLNEVSGVEVLRVMVGSPADQVGLHPGDVILAYNGEKVLGEQQFTRLVAETPPNRRVRLICWRAGTEKDVVITTIARPNFQSTSDEVEVPRLHIVDVPQAIMLWRNVVLGIESGALNDQLAQALGVKQGILIWAVTPSYPAQQAGLRAGDVLIQFCGHPINSPREIGLMLQQWPNEQKPLPIDVVRDHKSISVKVSLDVEH